MKIIKNNWKFIVFIFALLILINIRFPYYIDAPGGISDVSKKIEIDGYKSTGSFNLAYVREYNATIPTLIYSFFNKDWNILKKEEVLLSNEDAKTYYKRDKILMDESISNAIYVAYKYSNSKIEVLSNKLIVTFVSDEAKTDFKVSDEIISIDSINVSNKKEIENIINAKKFNDKINIKVKNNNKIYDRYAYVINSDGEKKIGIIISNIKEYETYPKIKIKIDKNESGSSGGLITALSIYNSLTKDDITNGLTIVGTGTIDEYGNIGSIGGVEYKLKSAVKNKADIFIVPNDDNYKEAIKLKKKYNYDIEIFGASTFEEVVEFLRSKS